MDQQSPDRRRDSRLRAETRGDGRRRRPAEVLASELEATVDSVRASAAQLPHRPRVYFDHIYERTGWAGIPAIAEERAYEIDSSIILQPGPAALTDGLDEIHRLLAGAVGR